MLQTELDFISKYYQSYLAGMGTTLLLSLIGIVGGTLLGLFITGLKLSKKKVFRTFGNVYVEIIRGTPLMVQLLLIYFGLKAYLQDTNAFLTNSIFLCSLAIIVNEAAYNAELIRGGILSVPRGQTEAARCLGLTQKQTMRYIVLPQAVKTILPSLGNEFVALIKETAIVVMVGIPDIIYKANAIKAATYQPIRPMIYAAVCYFVLTFTLSKVMKRVERSMAND
ncbi:amino acid ABC transporter permease [Peptoniphilus equinus]|uniref:Amino acid ABC transporter permease n=1 Tax=Peptoniphilus equinus TaxID=3016343 RepID=A0ABY7QVK8_9FIRM|nr:amino acid ABC transporter permease [Peptoniphilus equinus]WBW50095.1 amino acid ABC transporter permease [Peptoniphilus equinus]